MPFAAGQAVLIRGPGQSRSRTYSIATAPDEVLRCGSLELLVGHGSESEGDQRLAVGIQVEVRGPVGEFTLAAAPEDSRLVFVAGGCGIAPLRSMLREALSRKFAGISLVQSARIPEELAYAKEFGDLASSGRIEWHPKVTRADRRDTWPGPRGRIAQRDLEAAVQAKSAHCFVCGPPSMVVAVRRQLLSCSVSPARIHVEAHLLPALLDTKLGPLVT